MGIAVGRTGAGIGNDSSNIDLCVSGPIGVVRVGDFGVDGEQLVEAPVEGFCFGVGSGEGGAGVEPEDSDGYGVGAGQLAGDCVGDGVVVGGLEGEGVEVGVGVVGGRELKAGACVGDPGSGGSVGRTEGGVGSQHVA